VLFLTARDSVEDRIAGITAAATTTSPSRSARGGGRSAARPGAPGGLAAAGGREIVVGDLAMDEDAREVRRGGDLVELTRPSSSCCAT